MQLGFSRVRLQLARPARPGQKPVSYRSHYFSREHCLDIFKNLYIFQSSVNYRLDDRRLQPFIWAELAAVATDSDAEYTHVELAHFYEGIINVSLYIFCLKSRLKRFPLRRRYAVVFCSFVPIGYLQRRMSTLESTYGIMQALLKAEERVFKRYLAVEFSS